MPSCSNNLWNVLFHTHRMASNYENSICQLEFVINLLLHYQRRNSINMESSARACQRNMMSIIHHKHSNKKLYGMVMFLIISIIIIIMIDVVMWLLRNFNSTWSCKRLLFRESILRVFFMSIKKRVTQRQHQKLFS